MGNVDETMVTYTATQGKEGDIKETPPYMEKVEEGEVKNESRRGEEGK